MREENDVMLKRFLAFKRHKIDDTSYMSINAIAVWFQNEAISPELYPEGINRAV